MTPQEFGIFCQRVIEISIDCDTIEQLDLKLIEYNEFLLTNKFTSLKEFKQCCNLIDHAFGMTIKIKDPFGGITNAPDNK